MRLRVFGILLSLESLLLILFWQTMMPLREILKTESIAICWPLVNNCDSYHALIASSWPWLLALIGVTGVGAAVAFWRDHWLWGKCLLLAMVLIKNLVIFADLRLGGNYHSLITLISLIFIFIPSPQRLILVMIGLFYFVAGLLKFNQDWLSGVLINATWVPESLRPVAAAFAIVLELILVFALFSTRPKKFYPVFSLFVLFHVISLPSTGFLYPAVMLILLSAFPLFRKASIPLRWEKDRSLIVVPAIFIAFQIPNFTARGDNALTGENRNWSLIMYDAATVCDIQIPWQVGQHSGLFVKSDLKLQPRVHCDPIHYASFAKSLCRNLSNSSEQPIVGLNIISRRLTDKLDSHLVEESNLCRSDFEIHSLGENSWIQPEKMISLGDPVIFRWNSIAKISTNKALIPNSQIELSTGKIRLLVGNKELWTVTYPLGGPLKIIESSKDLLILAAENGDRWIGLSPSSGKLLWTLLMNDLATAQKKEPGIWEVQTSLPYPGVQKIEVKNFEPTISSWSPALTQ